MSVAGPPQHMQSLAAANRMRVERSRQRKALIGKPLRELVPALIDPTPEIASYRIGELFVSSRPSLIQGFGRSGLCRALRDAELSSLRRSMHEEMRLRDLTRREREFLVRSVAKHAPPSWREPQSA